MGAHEEDGDDDDEDAGFHRSGHGGVALDVALHDPDDDPAHQRAAEAGEPAEQGGGEGPDEHQVHEVGTEAEQRRHQDAGHGRQGGRDAPGEHRHLRSRDAPQPDGGEVLGRRPHRHPEERPAQEERQQQRDPQADQEDQQPVGRQHDAAHDDRRLGEQRRDGAGNRAGQLGQREADDLVDGQRGHGQGQDRRRRQRPGHQPLGGDAGRRPGGDGRRQGDEHRHVVGIEVPEGVGADRPEPGVGEVDHPGSPVEQHQPNSHQHKEHQRSNRDRQRCQQHRNHNPIPPKCQQRTKPQRDGQGFGSAQIRNLKPRNICEREVSRSRCAEQSGREAYRRHASGNRNHPERHTCRNTEKQRHQRDQVGIPHEMLHLKIMKVPMQDRIRNVPVSGVIAGVNHKVCGFV